MRRRLSGRVVACVAGAVALQLAALLPVVVVAVAAAGSGLSNDPLRISCGLDVALRIGVVVLAPAGWAVDALEGLGDVAPLVLGMLFGTAVWSSVLYGWRVCAAEAVARRRGKT